MKKVKKSQFYLQGPVPGWFMRRHGPLMSAIDLPLLTSSPRPKSAPARGWLRLISVMEGRKKLETRKGWSKKGSLFYCSRWRFGSCHLLLVSSFIVTAGAAEKQGKLLQLLKGLGFKHSAAVVSALRHASVLWYIICLIGGCYSLTLKEGSRGFGCIYTELNW